MGGWGVGGKRGTGKEAGCEKWRAGKKSRLGGYDVEGELRAEETKILTSSRSGIPWAGPIYKLPIGMSWIKFTEWGRIFGPIFHLKIFGADHVWISDESVATELMSKK